MRLYRDDDADVSLLERCQIGVIGYGNQGRAQALNLRDSGLSVVIGNREDNYATRAREDGFEVLAIGSAAARSDIVMILVPDEIMPEVFEKEIAAGLASDSTVVFASGYCVAFGLLTPPEAVDVVLVAPRMIGTGVRDLYVAGSGFPAFAGVHQDHSGQAWPTALALAKAIGSTRVGVVEVTFAQEAELDLFTEQCFGPAFGHVLTTAVSLLVEEGYPPEAVLLELYMSGEFSYTLGKIAELGMVEQTALHSHTSQYGSMSRGMRFMSSSLRHKMASGLEEIRSGLFAREWAEEQRAGYPTLKALREAALSLPLYEMEQELRGEMGQRVTLASRAGASSPSVASSSELPGGASSGGVAAAVGGLFKRLTRQRQTEETAVASDAGQMKEVLGEFLMRIAEDQALRDFSEGRHVGTHYVLPDLELEFYMAFDDGTVLADWEVHSGAPTVRLQMNAGLLDAMFLGRTNPVTAAMSGRLTFSGDAKLALSIQQIQSDLSRLYRAARSDVLNRRDSEPR